MGLPSCSARARSSSRAPGRSSTRCSKLVVVQKYFMWATTCTHMIRSKRSLGWRLRGDTSSSLNGWMLSWIYLCMLWLRRRRSARSGAGRQELRLSLLSQGLIFLNLTSESLGKHRRIRSSERDEGRPTPGLPPPLGPPFRSGNRRRFAKQVVDYSRILRQERRTPGDVPRERTRHLPTSCPTMMKGRPCK